MTTDRNSYASITKAIGLFGGVKLFQILVNYQIYPYELIFLHLQQLMERLLMLPILP